MRLFLLIAAALALHGASAAAQDEHGRRLAATLAIMQGDARQLLAADLAPVHREGLRARLAGDLSSLPMLLRRHGADGRAAAPLRERLAHADWAGLERALAELRRRFPLAPDILAAPPTPALARQGEAIHRETCSGCHDNRLGADTALPAHDLFEMARRQPRDEFAARLIASVRGDITTAYDNPFSEQQLAALLLHYQGAAAP
mgnify:FL=1